MGPFYLGHQYLGRQAAIGCVALEITQRCNLDCSLCYLSENSAQVKEFPLQELLRRLEQIRRHFGVGTIVQITGGDLTLRDCQELVAVMRRARELGLPPALLTNGIQASRALLTELAEVVMVAGRSGIHRAGKLALTLQPYEGQFQLHFLPAHCGQHLNPIEGFWRVMKDALGAGRCVSDLHQLYQQTRQVLMAHREQPIYEFHW
jgi:hypothetical protein